MQGDGNDRSSTVHDGICLIITIITHTHIIYIYLEARVYNLFLVEQNFLFKPKIFIHNQSPKIIGFTMSYSLPAASVAVPKFLKPCRILPLPLAS